MGKLAFCDYHNMVAILEKTEHNTDFHQIVDFLEASHIRYALMVHPTVYVAHIQQFWSTARVETVDEATKIIATVNGRQRTLTESSIRRHLKLNDAEGISTLPDTDLFENLSLMGYNILPNQRFSFQKGQFSHQWKFLIHTIMQCLSPKSTSFNEFSSNIATAIVCLATNRVYNFSKMIFDGMSKVPLPGEDETASPSGYDRHGEAFPTATSLDTGQDRENITKTSTMPHEASPRVTSFGGGEGTKIQSQDLEITQLKTRIKTLKDNEKMKEGFAQEDAPNTGGVDQREDLVEKSTDKGSESTCEISLIGVAVIQLRVASPLTHHPSEIPSPPLLLPSTTHIDDIPEVDMSLQKRARLTTLTGREVGYGIEDIWDDMVGDMEERAPTIVEGLSHRDNQALQKARVNILFKDMRYHLHTAVLMESEAWCTRQAWSQAMDCNKINEDSSCDIGGLDSLLQTQLTATLGRIQTLEARDPIRTNDPEDAGSSS
ncbi:hypothetical protein Tco_0320946 [Tanacetum coccineum]